MDMNLLEEKFKGLPDHKKVAFKALKYLSESPDVIGLYLSGSFAKGLPDIYSDLDINILVDPTKREKIVKEHQENLIKNVGKIATLFPATHLGDPNQIIVFYEEGVPIHVDYQYRVLEDLLPTSKNKDVLVLFDPGGVLTEWKSKCLIAKPETLPINDKMQYFEDRFWGWCAYTDAKIERGELWESRDALEYLRSNVLVSLAYFKLGLPNEGNRRLESKFPTDILNSLTSTVPLGLDKNSYKDALLSTIECYTTLFRDVSSLNTTNKTTLADREYFIRSIKS